MDEIEELGKPKENENPDTIKAEFLPYLERLRATEKGAVVVKASTNLDNSARFKTYADALIAKDEMKTYRLSWLYFSSAALLDKTSDSIQDSEEKAKLYSRAGDIFHFSGHGFRDVEEYRRSGEAYNLSGVCFEKAVETRRRLKQPLDEREADIDKGIRAYRRAKGVWSEVGDYDTAGEAYFSEQRLVEKRAWTQDVLRGLGFFVWGKITGYGEKFTNWAITLIVIIALFGLANLVGGLSPSQALLVSVERSLLIANPTGDPWLLVVQMACSYFLLGLGLALIVRRFGPR